MLLSLSLKRGVVVIAFISENFVLCISAIYVFLTMIMSIKLNNRDIKSVDEHGKNFSELPVRIRHRILFRGKRIKLLYALVAVLAWVVLSARLSKTILPLLACVLSVFISAMLVFVLFEITFLASLLLRKVINVNSPSLNIMFSSVIFIVIFFCCFTVIIQNAGLSIYRFVMLQGCLGCCYIVMVFVLLLVLREATSVYSKITFKNLWKSAFLTIILFLFILTLMSFCCAIYDENSFKGAENGFFDMFYYTVITFATVGYGDIVPISTLAKAVSVLTVFTSILCITILLSEIAGIKKKLSEE